MGGYSGYADQWTGQGVPWCDASVSGATLRQSAGEPQGHGSEMRRQPEDPERPHTAKREFRQNEQELRDSDEPFTDQELTDLALASDPNIEVSPDAVPIDELLTSEDSRDADDLLPSWYMPAIAKGSLEGWRRRVVLLIVIAFAATTAYGVCTTYGLFGL